MKIDINFLEKLLSLFDQDDQTFFSSLIKNYCSTFKSTQEDDITRDFLTFILQVHPLEKNKCDEMSLSFVEIAEREKIDEISSTPAPDHSPKTNSLISAKISYQSCILLELFRLAQLGKRKKGINQGKKEIIARTIINDLFVSSDQSFQEQLYHHELFINAMLTARENTLNYCALYILVVEYNKEKDILWLAFNRRLGKDITGFRPCMITDFDPCIIFKKMLTEPLRKKLLSDPRFIHVLFPVFHINFGRINSIDTPVNGPRYPFFFEAIVQSENGIQLLIDLTSDPIFQVNLNQYIIQNEAPINDRILNAYQEAMIKSSNGIHLMASLFSNENTTDALLNCPEFIPSFVKTLCGYQHDQKHTIFHKTEYAIILQHLLVVPEGQKLLEKLLKNQSFCDHLFIVNAWAITPALTSFQHTISPAGNHSSPNTALYELVTNPQAHGLLRLLINFQWERNKYTYFCALKTFSIWDDRLFNQDNFIHSLFEPQKANASLDTCLFTLLWNNRELDLDTKILEMLSCPKRQNAILKSNKSVNIILILKQATTNCIKDYNERLQAIIEKLLYQNPLSNTQIMDKGDEGFKSKRLKMPLG